MARQADAHYDQWLLRFAVAQLSSSLLSLTAAR